MNQSVNGKGRGLQLSPCLGEDTEAMPILSPQAGFLITNALRFMFNAPGVTSWQYTLLQLQVRVPCCASVLFPPFCGPEHLRV